MKRLLAYIFAFLLLSSVAVAEKNISILINSGETLITQDDKGDTIVVLVESPAFECRYLRILQEDGSVISSQPLPGTVSLDTPHSGPDSILLSIMNETVETYISFVRKGKDQWICENVQLFGDRSLSCGIDSIADMSDDALSPCRNDGIIYGEWRIPMPVGKLLQYADLSLLPMTCEEAWAQLDTSVYAYVRNPNPEDRLHLRVGSDKNASSLGKFYNRTPVQVLRKDKEWSFVCIGSEERGLTGYIMTKYLAFGDEKDSVQCAFPQLFPNESYQNTGHGPAIYKGPMTYLECEGYFGSDDYIIGVYGDEWLVVMTREGLVGYCQICEFDEGNG